ncbi:excisionase [Azospirillum palustre]|uniref:Excisionase n=1 Tax=Azospirillum palustre TaxID=2044885 RepID=A0A2B8BGI8_9PROT|nr:helix-turn-helix domain-containing protein [Azospirillum palustre]PGH56492.1 excisionase [Azospirillum palustre]
MHSQSHPICVTIKDAVKMIGVGNTKFHELLNSGEIEAVKSGRQTLVLTSSLHKYVENLPRRPIKG